MIAAFKIWFSTLNKTSKIIAVFCFILFLALSLQSARLARSEYLRLKQIEKEMSEVNKKIKLTEEKEEKIVRKTYEKAKKTVNSNELINKKLKQDEKSIDSSSISTNERSKFVSKYESR